LVQILLF